MTEQSISTAKGKQCCVHEDPYARGEWSDKCTKPNALSITANVRAHMSASTVMPAIVSASTSQPITTYTHASTSIVVPALLPVPTSQPITTHAHISTVMPTLLPALTSQPITAKAHACTHAPVELGQSYGLGCHGYCTGLPRALLYRYIPRSG